MEIEKCPKCGSNLISIKEIKHYRPTLKTKHKDSHPFKIDYLVDCLNCHQRTEVAEEDIRDSN